MYKFLIFALTKQMKKETKRKAFKFYRSYYDVYNELNDKDKLKFIEALLDRQFQGVKPKKLTGMVMFAYLSQEHSIDLQVKGYEDAVGKKLTPYTDPPKGGIEGGLGHPLQQEKEKEKEKEKSIYVDFNKLLEAFNDILGKKARVIPDKAKKQIRDRLKEGYNKEDIITALINASKDSYHIDTNYKYVTLEFISRPDKFERFVNMNNYKIKRALV
jgi:hypothetical protein